MALPSAGRLLATHALRVAAVMPSGSPTRLRCTAIDQHEEAIGLARLTGGQKVVSSNLTVPTTFFALIPYS